MSDLISRQAATNALWAERERLDNFMAKCLETWQMDSRSYAKAERNQVEKDIYIIMDLPSAQPQRMRGRWIEHKWAEEVGGFLISNYVCSCCSSWERTDSDYCPNCGADMRGEQK